MSVAAKNYSEPKKCNLNISFDLDDFIEYPFAVSCESHKTYIKCGEKNNVQNEQTNENGREYEIFKVSLDVSFDHNDLEPISVVEELFSTEEKSPISRGISKVLNSEKLFLFLQIFEIFS